MSWFQYRGWHSKPKMMFLAQWRLESNDYSLQYIAIMYVVVASYHALLTAWEWCSEMLTTQGEYIAIYTWYLLCCCFLLWAVSYIILCYIHSLTLIISAEVYACTFGEWCCNLWHHLAINGLHEHKRLIGNDLKMIFSKDIHQLDSDAWILHLFSLRSTIWIQVMWTLLALQTYMINNAIWWGC